MFATDRDLLVVEPNLFRDVVWIGQRLCKATGSTLNTTLTVSDADVDFVDAAIAPGHVVTVDGAACEVIERISATELTVSRLRADPADLPIPVTPATDKPVLIVTFAPQLRLIHHQILRMLAVEPSGPSTPTSPTSPTESSITNPADLIPVEVFGTLFLILSAASATTGPQSPLGIRAAFYRALFSQERASTHAQLDLDGDGNPDTIRRMNVAALQRQ